MREEIIVDTEKYGKRFEIVQIPVCSLCGGKNRIQWHHLVPKQYSGQFSETIPVCKICHRAIHQNITNKKFMLYWNTLEKLLKYKFTYGLKWRPSILRKKNRWKYDNEKINEKAKRRQQKELERQMKIENEIKQEQKLIEAEKILKVMRNGR
jgi:hypothetical protein